MVLYGITLVPLAEELRDEYPTLLYPFYANDAAFDGLERRSAAQLRLLIDWGTDWSYFPEPYMLLFIADDQEKKEAARQEFKQVGLHINCVDGNRYLVDYLRPREELEEWVRPKLKAWTHGFHTLAKIYK